MRCRDIAKHFKSVAPYVDWDHTTDTFKAGDPEREVKTIAVAWKATWNAMKEAYAKGADLFITHESICVHAENSDPDPEAKFALVSEQPKFQWLERSSMVVFRCHDTWDGFPEIGVRWSWHHGLALGGKVVNDLYPLLVTEIEPMSVEALSQKVLACVRPLGQNGILVWGNQQKMVRRVATGTGVTGNPNAMISAGADVGICTDDYFRHVREGAHAIELDFPGIIVNHGVSEELGIANLAKYLAKTFPEANVFHIPQRCAYTVVV